MSEAPSGRTNSGVIINLAIIGIGIGVVVVLLLAQLFIDDPVAAEPLDLTLAFEVKLEGLQEQTGGQRISMDEMMQQLRGDYRASVTGMSDQLYVEYAKEIRSLDEFLVRLRTDEHLSPRERTQKEIIEASVALRRHFITPIQPISLNDEQSD